ncbi:MAG: hypothetical protein OD814_000180 [Candidatus Alkanophagales archaeon MCA70_species_1]|nr:hypothetical protein [Candidatus Alkanophaga volatiphilum]
MCDIVIAAENARLGARREARRSSGRRGQFCRGSSASIRRRGFCSSVRCSMRGAERIGLVTAPPDRKGARGCAGKLAGAPPFAIRLAQPENRRSTFMGFTAALRAHFDTHILSHATREAKLLQKELSGKEQRRRRVRKSGWDVELEFLAPQASQLLKGVSRHPSCLKP